MQTTMSMYQESIAERLARLDRADVDPRHIEAWMRLEHSTLSGLTGAQFDAELAIGLACVDATDYDENEALAASYAL